MCRFRGVFGGVAVGDRLFFLSNKEDAPMVKARGLASGACFRYSASRSRYSSRSSERLDSTRGGGIEVIETGRSEPEESEGWGLYTSQPNYFMMGDAEWFTLASDIPTADFVFRHLPAFWFDKFFDINRNRLGSSKRVERQTPG